VFNIIFNNISVIAWRSVYLVEETGVPLENHWQTLSHNVVTSTTLVFANHFLAHLAKDSGAFAITWHVVPGFFSY
jgi:hypothetical protein